MRVAWWYGGGVVTLGVVAILAAALAAMRVPSGVAELNSAAQPVSVSVVQERLDCSAVGQVSAVRAEGPQVLSDGAEGVISQVHVSAGATFTQGSATYRAGSVTVKAYTVEQVFFRPIGPGSQGEDVRMARELISVLTQGPALASSSSHDASFRSRMKAYAASIGAPPTEIFYPSWFVRLPYDKLVVDSVPLVVGRLAPALGEVVATEKQRIGRITVSSEGDGPDGAYEFVIAGRTLPLLKKNGS